MTTSGTNAIERSDSDTGAYSAETGSGRQLTLELWHPDCWMAEVTTETDGRLLVNAVYLVDGNVKTHVVAYAETTDTIDDLVAATRESPHTYSVSEMYTQQDYSNTVPATKATRSMLVEYDPADSIHDALVSRGFIPQEPLRIRDGNEYWRVVVDEPHDQIRGKLDEVAEEKDAEISVQRVSATSLRSGSDIDTLPLSDRQREVFERARARGYYQWPRGVSGDELADEFGIARTTLLEHLRKAEAKLLGPE